MMYRLVEMDSPHVRRKPPPNVGRVCKVIDPDDTE